MSRRGSAGDGLDRDRIVELLGLLDRRLREVGVSARLYVVGGAAVAVTVADRRVTRDVDVASLDAVVRAEAEAIAAAEGLPADWLNAAAAPWIPPPAGRAKESVAEPGLMVEYAPPEHLLAMKMVALRQQDAPDISALAAHLGLHDAAQFAKVLRSVYSGEGALQQVLGVPDDRVDDEVAAITRKIAAFVSRARSEA
jgi:hypothetical protein